MESLSVFRGILNQPVPKAFTRLLWSADRTEQEFLDAWGSFFAALCGEGASGSLRACLLNAALYDENAFTLAAARGDGPLPEELLDAAERDLNVIFRVSSLTPQDLLAGCALGGEMHSLDLPRWKTGSPPESLSAADAGLTRQAARFCRSSGCGIYARRRAFIWRGGDIRPILNPDRTALSDLRGYELQRRAAEENTLAFLNGLPANNCLLYGDRGTGKSSTVKALLNEYYPRGLRMIEMPKGALSDFPILVDKIARLPMKFIIFIDDLSFSRQDETYASLKAVLEGGLAARPENTLIYATSNRRHLIRETFSDREGDELHLGDTIQESLSLADRFGLAVHFSLPGKDEYLQIVRQLAGQRGLAGHLNQLEEGAERWALSRGGRSPRCARQYIRAAEARIKSGLLPE